MLVEDDKALANGIVLALRDADKEIEPCYNLKSASMKFNEGNYALVILDLNLPDGSGLDLLKEIKARTNTPVILVTANDMEMDIVTGLDRKSVV